MPGAAPHLRGSIQPALEMRACSLAYFFRTLPVCLIKLLNSSENGKWNYHRMPECSWCGGDVWAWMDKSSCCILAGVVGPLAGVDTSFLYHRAFNSKKKEASRELGCGGPHLKPELSRGHDWGGISSWPPPVQGSQMAADTGSLFASPTCLIFSSNFVSLSCCCKCVNVFWFIWAADLFCFIGSKINGAAYAVGATSQAACSTAGELYSVLHCQFKLYFSWCGFAL